MTKVTRIYLGRGWWLGLELRAIDGVLIVAAIVGVVLGCLLGAIS